jgi:hypothetical protein
MGYSSYAGVDAAMYRRVSVWFKTTRGRDTDNGAF